MLGLSGLLIEELKKSLESSGLKADVSMMANELVVTIRSSELRGAILERLPPEWRPFVDVECSDIKVKFKMVV